MVKDEILIIILAVLFLAAVFILLPFFSTTGPPTIVRFSYSKYLPNPGNDGFWTAGSLKSYCNPDSCVNNSDCNKPLACESQSYNVKGYTVAVNSLNSDQYIRVYQCKDEFLHNNSLGSFEEFWSNCEDFSLSLQLNDPENLSVVKEELQNLAGNDLAKGIKVIATNVIIEGKESTFFNQKLRILTLKVDSNNLQLMKS